MSVYILANCTWLSFTGHGAHWLRFVNTPIQQVEVGRLGDCTLMMTSSPFACLAQLTLLQGDSIARVIAHYKLTANHLARTGAKFNWIPLMQSLYACRPRSKNKNSQLLCFLSFSLCVPQLCCTGLKVIWWKKLGGEGACWLSFLFLKKHSGSGEYIFWVHVD